MATRKAWPDYALDAVGVLTGATIERVECDSRENEWLTLHLEGGRSIRFIAAGDDQGVELDVAEVFEG